MIFNFPPCNRDRIDIHKDSCDITVNLFYPAFRFSGFVNVCKIKQFKLLHINFWATAQRRLNLFLKPPF